MKPTILIDMDGVIADFDDRYRSLMNLMAEEVAFTVSREEQTHYYCTKHLKPQYERFIPSMTREIHSPGFFANLLPMDGAIDGVRAVERHAYVRFVTKPLSGGTNRSRDEKALWLDKWFGPNTSDWMITSHFKSDIRGHILLDDAHVPTEINQALWSPVAYRAPHNLIGGDHFLEGVPHFSWDEDPMVLAEYAAYCMESSV